MSTQPSKDRSLASDNGTSSTSDVPTISRRRLARNAGTMVGGLAASGAFATRATAQDASPEASPAASPVAVVTPDPNATFTRLSPPREEVIAQLKAAYPFEDPAQTGGDLVQVFSTDLQMVNPLISQDLASTYITGLVYQSLVGINPIDGTYVPELADSWELSSDGLRWRFALNPNATWHDGEPVTADDVIYSFEAILAPEGFSPSRGTVDRALADIQKIDDYTVELIAPAPIAIFLNDTALNVPIMPRHIWEDVPFADWPSDDGSTGRDPSRVVGSGPFKFVEWVPGSHATVTSNDDYWLPELTPVIERYIYQVVAESGVALQALETGEADISNLSPAQAPEFIDANPEMEVTEYNRAHITYYETNMDESKTTLFQDVRVRRAMLYGLDRELIVENVFLGYAVVADGPQPPLSPAYAPEEITTVYRFDPERARQLLDEAGWEVGADGIREKDGVSFSFEFTYEQDSATYAQLIPYMQQAWADIGLEMIPVPMPFPAQQEQLNQREYEAALTGITLNTTGSQSVLFRCDSIYPAGFNEVMYCNHEYDRLDDLQREELDPEARREILIQQAIIIAEDAPVAPLVFVNGLVANRPRVHNYFPTGYSPQWSMNWVWVEQ